jgi:hypothetical protein
MHRSRSIPAASRRARALAVLAALLGALLLPPPASAGKIKFGGSSGSSSWAAKPSTTSSWGSKPAIGTPAPTVTGTPALGGAGGGSFKPAPGAALPTMPVKPAGAVGGMGGAGGFMGPKFGSSSSWGQRRSSIMPFALGAFAGEPAAARGGARRRLAAPRLPGTGAACVPGGTGGLVCLALDQRRTRSRPVLTLRPHSPPPAPRPPPPAPGTAAFALLSSNPSARCNGIRPECYRSFCVKAQEGCPDTKGKQLSAIPCPGPTWTECWGTNDTSFQCLGHPRPTASNNIDAFCLAALKNGTVPAGFELVGLQSTRSGAAPARRAGALAAALLAGAALLFA